MKNEVAVIPWEETWLTVKEASELIGFSNNYITNVLAAHADFPVASRLGNGPRRWKAGELNRWMEKNREKRVGRPRGV